MATNFSLLPIEKKSLFIPPLEEISNVLQLALQKSYEEVTIQVVECPDLTKGPFNLSSPGLGGSPKIVDLGGPPYLLPLVNREKIYDLKDLPTALKVNPAFIIGAGAGPFPYAGQNCEGVFNLNVNNGKVDQHSVISKVKKPEETIIQQTLPNSETRCALLANLFISEGLSGKVLEVKAKKRIGQNDFISNIRIALQDHYQDKIVGLGGTFLIKTGKAKQHIMDDFSVTPLISDDDVNNWLYFFNMSAPLVAVGTLVSGDYDLDLRVQHFHSFSDHNEAGHYHIDTTPEEVEYIGYFNIAETIYRIDRPANTHQIGRD